MRFPIRFGPLSRILLTATGLAQRWCWLDVGDERLVVRMSWAFQAVVPLDAIRVARPHEGRRPLNIGVHGFGGRWLVNGSRDGLVTIELGDGQRARVIGWRVKLRELTVSVVEVDQLVDALHR